MSDVKDGTNLSKGRMQSGEMAYPSEYLQTIYVGTCQNLSKHLRKSSGELSDCRQHRDREVTFQPRLFTR